MLQIVKFSFESLHIFTEFDGIIFLPLHVFSFQTIFCQDKYLTLLCKLYLSKSQYGFPQLSKVIFSPLYSSGSQKHVFKGSPLIIC